MMSTRPWKQDRNKKIVSKTVEAMAAVGKQALQMIPAAQPVTRIENMIRFDVNEVDLAKWRNDGWTVQYYQFLGNALAAVLERVVAVTPQPQRVEVVEEIAAAEPVVDEKTLPFSVPISDSAIIIVEPASPSTVPALQPDFVSALRNPNMTVADVIDAANQEIVNAARDTYNALRPTIDRAFEPFEVHHG